MGILSSLNFNRSCKVIDVIEGLEIGFVGGTRGFSPTAPAKSSSDLGFGKSLLESLPQHVLIRVFCGVDHEDLGQLFLVSKTIKEAALQAKNWHFEYSTPRSQTKSVFTVGTDFDEAAEVLNTPRGDRYRVKLDRETLDRLAVRLFD